MEEVEGRGRSFGETLGKLGKLAVGAGLAGITAAVAGVGLAAQKTIPMAMEFTDSIVELDLAAPDTAGSLEDLRKAALMVGGDTKVLGASASGAAEAMTGLFKSGLDVNAIMGDMQGYLAGTAELGGALKGAFDLAAASELDVVQASDAAAVMLATFGGEMESGAEQAEFITAALNNTVQAADASVAEVSDLVEALGMVGPTAAQLGYSIEDTNNALALLSTAGIAGSRAGSNLDAALRSLSDPTNDATDSLRALGIELYDENGNFKDLGTIVGLFENALAGMTQEQKAAYLGSIFTAQGQRAMNVLLQQGAEGWSDMAQATAEATTISDKAAAKAATLSGQWEGFQGVIETLGIQLGDIFLPYATQLLTWAGQIAEQYGPPLLEWFGSVAEAVQPFIQYLGTLLMTGDPLNDFLVDLPDGFRAVIDAVQNATGVLSVLSDWFQLVLPIAIDVASTYWNDYLVPLFLSLKEQWETKLQPALAELWAWLQERVPQAIEVVAGFWESTLKPAFQAVATFIVETLVPAIGDVVAWLIEHLPPAIDAAAQFWTETLQPALNQVWEFIRDNVIPIIQDVVAWLQENIPVAIAEAQRVWEEVLLPALTTVYEFVRDEVIPIIETVVAWLQENIPAAIEEARRVWEEVLLPAITAVWGYLDQYIMPIFRSLVDILVLELQIIIEVLAGLWEKTLQPALETVWDYLSKNILPIFKDLIDWLGGESGLMPMLEKVASFLQETFLSALEKVGEAFKKATDFLAGFLDKVREWRKTDVPDEYKPGSPPPLYYALQDIGNQMAELSTVRLPQLAAAWATVPATASRAEPSTMGAMGLGERIAQAMNIDRSANVTVHANYADRQSESNVARDVQTVLELLGWQ